MPFENLDVQAGLGVSLAPEDIADKILARGRGGYCYEVNGLFCMAMQALGVPYHMWRRGRCSIPRVVPAPMALVLRLDGQDWLCDLGFGSYGIRAPMSLAVLDTDIRQDMDRFMLSREADGSTCSRPGATAAGRTSTVSTCRRRNGSISRPRTT